MEIGSSKALINKAAEDLLTHLAFRKIISKSSIRERRITFIRQEVIAKVYNKIIKTHFNITRLIKIEIILRTRVPIFFKIGSTWKRHSNKSEAIRMKRVDRILTYMVI